MASWWLMIGNGRSERCERSARSGNFSKPDLGLEFFAKHPDKNLAAKSESDMSNITVGAFDDRIENGNAQHEVSGARRLRVAANSR